MTESLMQQIQEAMNGGKKPAKRVKKAAKAVRKPTGAAGVVRKPAVAKPKRRVVRRTPMKFMGGFFAELNNMVAAEGDAADNADRKKAMSPAMLLMDGASGAATGMNGGRRIVYKKKAVKKPKVAKAVAKKPRFGSRGRMSFGGYEEMEEQVEERDQAKQEQAEQEGGRPKRRVVRRRRSASPARRRAASPARRRATSPARRR